MGQQAYSGDALTAPVRWSSCLVPQVHAERLRGAWERLVVPCSAEMSTAAVFRCAILGCFARKRTAARQVA